MFSQNNDEKIQQFCDHFVRNYLHAEISDRPQILMECCRNELFEQTFKNNTLPKFIKNSIKTSKGVERLSMDEKSELFTRLQDEIRNMMVLKKEIDEITPGCKKLIKAFFENSENPPAWKEALSTICQLDIKEKGYSSLLRNQLIANINNTNIGKIMGYDAAINIAVHLWEAVKNNLKLQNIKNPMDAKVKKDLEEAAKEMQELLRKGM